MFQNITGIEVRVMKNPETLYVRVPYIAVAINQEIVLLAKVPWDVGYVDL